MRLIDLDSHNGTFVNGERVEGTRLLVSGDVITIGGADARRCTRSRRRARAASDPRLPALRLRLVEEVDRALRYQRPLTLAQRGAAGGGAARRGRRRRSPPSCGSSTSSAVIGDAQLVVLLPELDAEAAALGDAAGARSAGGARVGVGALSRRRLRRRHAARRRRARRRRRPSPGAVAAAAAAARELVRRRSDDRRRRSGDGAALRADRAAWPRATCRCSSSARPASARRTPRGAVHHGSGAPRGPFVTLNCAAIAGDARRERAVRLREGRLHRRRRRQAGQARGGARRHPVPRRGRRAAAVGAGQAVARARGRSASRASATCASARSTCASWPRPTAISRTRSRPAASARISSSASARRRSCCRRCAIGRARSRCWRAASSPTRARRGGRDAAVAVGRRRCSARPRIAWPGNVRELRNAMEYVAATRPTTASIEPWHLPERDRRGRAAAERRRDRGTADGADAAGGAGRQARFRPLADELRELERAAHGRGARRRRRRAACAPPSSSACRCAPSS